MTKLEEAATDYIKEKVDYVTYRAESAHIFKAGALWLLEKASNLSWQPIVESSLVVKIEDLEDLCQSEEE